MSDDAFLIQLLSRGVSSALAGRVAIRYADWEALSAADESQLATHFSEEDIATLKRASTRREIPRATVLRLVHECEFRCCLCWDIDRDSGIVVHHIRAHATAPDDRYENLVVLCPEHHSKIHTKWELARHPYPPELLLRRKEEFIAAIAAFKAGRRIAPGRERGLYDGHSASPPLPPRSFTGRDDVASRIVDALRREKRVVAIVGMGGVGKTALATSIAAKYSDLFGGGSLWAEARGHSEGLRGWIAGWLRHFGRDGAETEIDQLLGALSGLLSKQTAENGPMLLLIDDAVRVHADDLVRLLSHVPNTVSILITTRDGAIAAALGASEVRLDPLGRESSRHLLQSFADSVASRSEAAAVDDLLSLLGDLPLAIELVGRQITLRQRKPGFSVAALCEKLRGFNPDVLSFPGHRGVAVSFALSYDYMEADEQRLFRCLGVFAPGPLLAEVLGAVGGETAERTETLLDSFVTLSLLTWGRMVGEYHIHPLLHSYAEFLLRQEAEPEQRSVRTAFYKHFAYLVKATAKPHGPDLVSLDAAFPNLTRAVEEAASVGDDESVLAMVWSLSVDAMFFTSRDLDRSSVPLLERAIAAAKHLADANSEGALTGHLGTAFMRMGAVREAATCYERAIAVSREVGDKYDLASHLQNLGTTLLSGGDLQRAEKALHDALDLAQQSRNADAALGSLSALGNLHRAVGRLPDAARCYSGALQMARLAGDRLSEGNNLSNLGLVTEQLGDADESERMIRDALKIAVEIGDRRGEGNRTGHIGGILLRKAQRLPAGNERSGSIQAARQYIQTALKFAQDTGDVEKTGVWNLGLAARIEGDDKEAIRLLREALILAESAHLGQLEAQIRFNLGLVLADIGDAEAGLGHLTASRALLAKMHSPLVADADALIEKLRTAMAMWARSRGRGPT